MTASNNAQRQDDFWEGPSYIPAPQTTIDEGTVTPPERGQLLKAIEYMGELKDDWNGFGASAPSNATLQTARRFIEKLPFGWAYPNQISPGMEESIAMKWVLESGNILHMTIDGLHINLSKLKLDEEIEDIATDLKFLPGAFFPENIKKELPRRRV